MREVIVENLRKRFAFYAELAGQLDDEQLNATLDVPGHRSLGLHLWCVVGTRESYAKAIPAGAMAGWASSVTALSQTELVAKLADSGRILLQAIEAVGVWTPEREALLAEVAEHEVMHEGQIIRAMFALDQPLPASCHWAVCG